MTTDDEARVHVITERKRRGVGWESVRKTAKHHSYSSQVWQNFENGGPLTEAVRLMIAEAFDWPADWPHNLPALTPTLDEYRLISSRVDDLETQMKDVLSALTELRRSLEAG